MFTGIIESTGTIEKVQNSGTNKIFQVRNPLHEQLKIDQSVSHDGVCLTIESISGDLCQVTAIAETLQKTNLEDWKVGTVVNLERCMPMNGRLDGHMVQGHVDTTAICTDIKERDGSWEFTIEFDKKFAGLVIEKGSAAVNGISLTIYGVTENLFKVAIIPYTYSHTNISRLQAGSKVNVEFDVIGKYVNRIAAIHAK